MKLSETCHSVSRTHHTKTDLEGNGNGNAGVDVSWVLDVEAEFGTEDMFNVDEGEINGRLLLEPSTGEDDPGAVEAGGTGAELIELMINRISNGRMADLRTSSLRKE